MFNEAGPFELSSDDFSYISTLVATNNRYHTIVECGVYRGASISRIRAVFGSSYDIWGFDSFEGLPEDWKGAPSHCKKGCFSTGGSIPSIEGVTFVKGWFEDTLPSFVKEHPEGLALLFIDCDLYNSSLQALTILNPIIKHGTILVFDEYYYNASIDCDDHEKAALEMWCDENSRKVKQLPFENGELILKQEKALFVVET